MMNLEILSDILIGIGMVLTLPFWGPIALAYAIVKHRKDIIRILKGPPMPKYPLGLLIAYPDELRKITARKWDGWSHWEYTLGGSSSYWINEDRVSAWIAEYGTVPLDEKS